MTIELDPEVERKLVSHARATGKPESVIMNKALVEYFEDQDDEMNQRR
jgi:predicted transcriptional regulator